MRWRKKAELPTAFLRCFKPYSANPKIRAVRVLLDIISCTRSCSCCQAAKYVKGLATVLAPGAPCLIVGKPRSRCGKQNGRNHLSGNSKQNTKEANLLFTYAFYTFGHVKWASCASSHQASKIVWWVISGIKFLMMVMAMALFGKMAHVPTKAFFLGNPAYKFWCLNEFDISPVKQLTLSSQSRHMHTHMPIVILFFCTEV